VPVSNVDAQRWRSDLHYMARVLCMTRMRFILFQSVLSTKPANGLGARIPSLTKYQIIVDLKCNHCHDRCSPVPRLQNE
jgi:hypothetical protein